MNNIKFQKDCLDIIQLRRVLDRLYDGIPETALYLTRIRSFYSQKQDITREHAVYLWLVKNNLCGLKLISFFQNEGSFLDGMNFIVNRMEGRKAQREIIKADELY